MMRAASVLMSLVNVLDVLTNPLFQRGLLLGDPSEAPPPMALWNGQQYGVIAYTRCNGYVGVLLALLGCPVPWMTANKYAEWFATVDAKNLGWRAIDYVEAVNRANAGYPVVAVAAEFSGHGHIAVGVPSRSNDPTTLYVTAAGAVNAAQARFVDQFAHLAPRACFYTHD